MWHITLDFIVNFLKSASSLFFFSCCFKESFVSLVASKNRSRTSRIIISQTAWRNLVPPTASRNRSCTIRRSSTKLNYQRRCRGPEFCLSQRCMNQSTNQGQFDDNRNGFCYIQMHELTLWLTCTNILNKSCRG